MQKHPWRIACASAIGTSHLRNGSDCEDSYAHCLVTSDEHEDVLIAAISDGAGSAEHSAIASRLACDSFVQLIREFLGGGGKVSDLNYSFAKTLIEGLSASIQAKAEEESHQIRDYACTLLGVVAGEAATAFFQIGDGAIVTSGGLEDGWSWVFWPQHGEFANTTNFIISENASELIEFDLAPRRVEEFAMFSDGIENLVLHQASKTVHAPFFESMFLPVRLSEIAGLDDSLSNALEKYLASPAICERTDDDKTLLLATRRSRPLGLVERDANNENEARNDCA